MFTPIIIIGGILTGVFTATEAGCVAAVYALLLGCVFYREISLKKLFHIFQETMILTGVITFIIAAAGAFGYLLSYYRVPHMIAEKLSSISSNPLIIVLLINVVYLFLGCLIDPTPIIIMTVPVVLPILMEMGIDLTYFGVVTVINMCIATITPPVGVVMYVMCDIADISVKQYTLAILPFLAVLVIALIILILFPDIILFLPRLLMG